MLQNYDSHSFGVIKPDGRADSVQAGSNYLKLLPIAIISSIVFQLTSFSGNISKTKFIALNEKQLIH